MTLTCDVLVVGAGMAGAVAAHELHAHGLDVAVVDKGRAPGGRLATRRDTAAAWDYGAQYFTARDERVMACARAWNERGWIEQWTPRTQESAPRLDGAWVGVPSMRALPLHLLDNVRVCRQTRIERLTRDGGRWHARAEDGSLIASAARVFVTAPAPQAVAMLPDISGTERLLAAAYAPCWALLITDGPADPGFDLLRPERGPLAWLARDGSKPGRAHETAWVAHTSPAWSVASLDEPAIDVVAALRPIIESHLGKVGAVVAHRWRFARVTSPYPGGNVVADNESLIVGGDAASAGRVAAAIQSGLDAAAVLRAGHR